MPLFFRNTKLVKAIKLEGLYTITINWYIAKCLREIQEVNVRRLILYFDIASSHSATMKIQFLQ